MDFRYFNQDTGEWESAIVGPDALAAVKAIADDTATRYPGTLKIVTDWNDIVDSGNYAGDTHSLNRPYLYANNLIGEYFKYDEYFGRLIAYDINDTTTRYVRVKMNGVWQPWILQPTQFGPIIQQRYETGIFTPFLLNNEAGTYAGQIGTYTIIGNIVHFEMRINVGTPDPNYVSSSTQVIIGGLPVTSSSSIGSCSIGYFDTTDVTSNKSVRVVDNQLYCYMGNTFLGSEAIVNGMTIILNGTYKI